MHIAEYKDDTIPVIYRHYLHGSQTLLTKHIYNASKQLIVDSNFHTAITPERTYLPSNQLYSQTDYVYTLDANTNLLKTVQTDLSGNVSEARFTNNSFGKPEKEERYYQNKLALTLYYYYE